MIDLLSTLLKRAAISTVQKQDLHLQLLSHSDYPSLRAITDTLDYFGIENIAANVPTDALDQLPEYFLALFQKDKVNSIVLARRKNDKVVVQNEAGKKSKYAIPAFEEMWTGTIIAIEVPTKQQRQFKPLLSSIGVLALIAIIGGFASFSFYDPTLLKGLFLSFSLIGLGVSYLIIKETFGEANAVSAKVCGAITSDSQGCGAVINSNQSEIIKGVGLGDISLIYFISAILIGTLVGVTDSLLLVVASLSLPVVVYTIYSQAFVLKKWCFLCLCISAVLVLQFVVVYGAFSSWDFSLSFAANTILITAFVALGWLLLKPLFKDSKKLLEVQKDYLSLKRDALVFESILKDNVVKDLKEVPEQAQIHFGNKEAEVQLTAYTNPLCGYCTEAFEGYDRLLSQFPTDLGIQLIFNTPVDTENPSTLISKRIIEIYDDQPEKAFSALKDWFKTKDIEQWQERFGKSQTMLLKYDAILDQHREIIRANEIGHTPETLLGDSKLSRKHYSYQDIALFIPYLKEQKNSTTVMMEVS